MNLGTCTEAKILAEAFQSLVEEAFEKDLELKSSRIEPIVLQPDGAEILEPDNNLVYDQSTAQLDNDKTQHEAVRDTILGELNQQKEQAQIIATQLEKANQNLQEKERLFTIKQEEAKKTKEVHDQIDSCLAEIQSTFKNWTNKLLEQVQREFEAEVFDFSQVNTLRESQLNEIISSQKLFGYFLEKVADQGLNMEFLSEKASLLQFLNRCPHEIGFEIEEKKNLIAKRQQEIESMGDMVSNKMPTLRGLNDQFEASRKRTEELRGLLLNAREQSKDETLQQSALGKQAKGSRYEQLLLFVLIVLVGILLYI